MSDVDYVFAQDSPDGSEGLLAIFVSGRFSRPGATFFTDPGLSQQVAMIDYPEGHRIQAHTHYQRPRIIHHTREVLVLKSGLVEVLVYSSDGRLAGRRVMEPGDVAVLVSGGHGVEFLRDSAMIEIKQGPFDPRLDKYPIQVRE